MLKKILSIGLILLIACVCGCSAQPPTVEIGEPADGEPSSAKATVIVTRDFGKELILEQEIEIEPGTSALHVLQMAADVETNYGGGFVNSINGISSEYEGTSNSQRDWFFYINGVSSNIGANDYILRDGDVEHWDFRDWSYHQFIPAIIGDFPQPFRSGYKAEAKPTVVVYEQPFLEQAQSLVEEMEELGVSDVSACSNNQLSNEAKQNSNLVIMAGSENELILELNGEHKRLGFYSYLEQGTLIALDAEGSISGELGVGCGLIQATQNPWNPKGIGIGESVAWMVTGTDSNGVENAADILINHHQELRRAFAVVISEGDIFRTP